MSTTFLRQPCNDILQGIPLLSNGCHGVEQNGHHGVIEVWPRGKRLQVHCFHLWSRTCQALLFRCKKILRWTRKKRQVCTFPLNIMIGLNVHKDQYAILTHSILYSTVMPPLHSNLFSVHHTAQLLPVPLLP